jgi:hypothetical protein
MDSWIGGWLSALILGFTFFGGWAVAHKTVAHECHSLGVFYVGDKVYECKLKEKSQ